MDNYLIITKNRGFDMNGYTIRAEYNGERLPRWNYYGYGKRDAIRKYREKFGLKNKKFIKVEW